MFRVNRKDSQPQQASSEAQEPKQNKLFGFRRNATEFLNRLTQSGMELSSGPSQPSSIMDRDIEPVASPAVHDLESDDFVQIGGLEKRESPLPEIEELDESEVQQSIEQYLQESKEKVAEVGDGRFDRAESEGGLGQLEPQLLETMWEFHEDQKLSSAQKIDRIERKVLSPQSLHESLLDAPSRHVKVLSFFRPLSLAPELTKFLSREFKGYDFTSDAVAKIANDIRDRIGEREFFKLVKQGCVAIEKVGMRKNGKDKYFLIIRKPDGGGAFSSFQIGYSRQGEKRGVNIEKNYANIAHSPEEVELLEKEREVKSQSLELAKRLTKENAPNVCQMMSFEAGVKVSRLGETSLEKFDVANLTKQQRLKLYRSLVEGLFQMHSVGLCHRDMKVENVVVHREANDDVVAWIIDLLDFLEEEGRNRLGTAIIGTKHMWSPDCVRAYELEQSQKRKPREEQEAVALANSKDDVWAAMLMICQMESKVPEQERLLSPEFMQMFVAYRETVMEESFMRKFCKSFHEYFNVHQNNLFQADQAPAIDYPLDRLVYQMAWVDQEQRLSSKQVLEQFPDQTDAFRQHVPVIKEAVKELRQLRQEYLELARVNDSHKNQAFMRYNEYMESCGAGFREAFDTISEKILQVRTKEAMQKQLGHHSSGFGQHEPAFENQMDIELQVLDHLLENLYIRFLDERTPVNATRQQVEQLYQLRFEINKLQSERAPRAGVDAKIDAYHHLLKDLGGPEGAFYKQVDNLGYCLMRQYEEQQRQQQAIPSEKMEGEAFVAQAYSNDFEMQALKAMLDDPYAQFVE
ncbi:MAG: hypothetical protein JSR57_10560 [Verrucomicrobia bacterium]|nr:hypothetical protein [Verrucomicrobiota bacterium]